MSVLSTSSLIYGTACFLAAMAGPFFPRNHGWSLFILAGAMVAGALVATFAAIADQPFHFDTGTFAIVILGPIAPWWIALKVSVWWNKSRINGFPHA